MGNKQSVSIIRDGRTVTNIGKSDAEGDFNLFIPRNSRLPVSKSDISQTKHNNQTSAKMEVSQENEMKFRVWTNQWDRTSLRLN